MRPDVDYYRILEIGDSATPEEIKSAYRKLAKENHPDSRGGDKEAEERFKEISEAYAILSNPQKRSQYDMIRKGGFNFQQGAPGGFDGRFSEGMRDNFTDIFSNLFGDFNGHSEPAGGSFNFEDIFKNRQRTRTTTPRGTDMQSTITIPFELAVNGGETIIKTGSGKKVKIKIPAGVEDGKKIRVRGQGAPASGGGQTGDLYLNIKVANHLEFERRGNDVYSSAFINMAEALLGTEILVKTVNSKQIKLKIPAGTSSGKVLKLPGMGVKHEGGTGDHYVRIEIDIPNNLTMGQRRDFRNWAKKVGLIT